MPPRTYRRKRTTRRRRKATRSKVALYRSPRYFGVPKYMTTNLQYNTTISLNPGIVANGFYQFSHNSLHDPDSTGVGHQPMLHDQFCYLYDKYLVKGAKITVRYMPDGASTTPGLWSVCSYRTTNTISGWNPDQIIEQKFQNPKLVRSCGVGAGNDHNTVIQKYSARKYNSIKKGSSLVNHEDLIGSCHTGGPAGSGSTSPAKQSYFAIWSATVGGNDPSPHSFLVTIDYNVLYFQPKSSSQS